MDEQFLDFDAPLTEAEMMAALLRELKSLAFIDIAGIYDENNKLLPVHQMAESVRRAIAGIEVDEIWSGTGHARELIGYTRKVKLWDKKGAIDSFMKHLGMFIERLEVKQTVTVQVQPFDIEERIELLTKNRIQGVN